MITKNMVLAGLDRDLIHFIPDPVSMTRTVCEIGDNFFYFGGPEAEKKPPEYYAESSHKSETAGYVFETLNDMREGESFSEEYAYYESVIRDGLRKRPTQQGTDGRMKHCSHCGYIGAVKSVHLATTGETKYKAVCLNEFCIASKNEFLYDTPEKAIEGWNFRVSPTAGGYSIYQ